MSNLGLELALKELGVPFLRAAVGDRHVMQMLRAQSGMLGGEASGHLLVLDKTTTGDGLIVALQVLAVMKSTGKSLAELAAGMKRFPQQLINVRVTRRFDAAREPGVAAAIARVEGSLGERGRVVLRASGTEPLIRVMVEGEDADLVGRHAEELAAAVRAAAPAA
jgi:phosphoglucosamine mutase